MFKEYILFADSTVAVSAQRKIGIDLTTLVSYTRSQSTNSTHLNGPAINVTVLMSNDQFDEFKINLKTAHRLKCAYE
jgi:hypothetical protein